MKRGPIRVARVRCDQCEALMINGVFCHERGCPNERKRWVEGRGWIRFLDCRVCGCEVEAGEVCGCDEVEWLCECGRAEHLCAVFYGAQLHGDAR